MVAKPSLCLLKDKEIRREGEREREGKDGGRVSDSVLPQWEEAVKYCQKDSLG